MQKNIEKEFKPMKKLSEILLEKEVIDGKRILSLFDKLKKKPIKKETKETKETKR